MFAGSVTAPPPSAAYFRPIAGPAKTVGELEVLKSAPKRSFEDLGTVQVSCPTVAQTDGYQFGSAVTHLHGGYSYAHALLLAQEKAARQGPTGCTVYKRQRRRTATSSR